MRETRLTMGMPVTVEIVDPPSAALVDEVFGYFAAVDRRFSPYRDDSELADINAGRLSVAQASDEMREVLVIAEDTRRESDGYFDARRPDGSLDPSGIVKGWAIRNAARMIRAASARDFYVDAGGDIQVSGRNRRGEDWSVGIRSPFAIEEIVRVVYPRDGGVATSGNYVRGQHIYNPHAPDSPVADIVSLTVIAPDVLTADRFATAAFAMGRAGIAFIERLPDCEGYMIAADGIATMTSGFKAYTRP